MRNSKLLPLLIIAVIVLGLVAIRIFNDASSDSRNTTSAPVQETPLNNPATVLPDLVIGEASALITIEEFGDYKCPSCNRFHQDAYQELENTHIASGKVKLVYRNLPYIADDSRVAALGAYCANEQNIFKDYHNGVFTFLWENYYQSGETSAEFENILTIDVLAAIVVDAKGDDTDFTDCVDSARWQHAVDRDLALSEQKQVYGTPTFIIGSQTIVGPQNFNFFNTIIEAQQ